MNLIQLYNVRRHDNINTLRVKQYCLLKKINLNYKMTVYAESALEQF